jgi:phosphatidylinositol alpha 1,6-mannosyltransferase
MGELARRSVEGRTWQAVGQELVQHYRDVVAEARDRDERAAA